MARDVEPGFADLGRQRDVASRGWRDPLGVLFLSSMPRSCQYFICRFR
jgi:hypothetical protein